MKGENMKRHEVLAALAAAAGLTLATPASAGVAGTIRDGAHQSLVELQQQVAQNDDALSQMIHLAKVTGHDRGVRDHGKGMGRGKGKGGDNGVRDHGKGEGKGKGKGRGHHHPS
jgi:hypothetical protein